MHFNIITLFPEVIQSYFSGGVVGRAFQTDEHSFQTISPREFTTDPHQTVDDKAFGGSDGMIMLADPLAQACEQLKQKNQLGSVILLSPHGELWKDELARDLTNNNAANSSNSTKNPGNSTPQNITLICGRYGGVDQRFIEEYVDREVSLGDYILSGGELGALVIIDSVMRLQPQVLGHKDSSEKESFAQGLLEEPQFTKPRTIFNKPVPEVLLNGDHKKIEQWRQHLSALKTAHLRWDLLQAHPEGETLLTQALEQDWDESELQSCGLSKSILQDLRDKLEQK